MANRVIDRAYESIRGYVPEDVKQVLSDQIPKIEKFVDDELEKFGEELSSHIQAEIDALIQKTEAEASQAQANMKTAVEAIRADIAANDHDLEAAVNQLETSLNEYEDRFRNIGEGIRKAALTAVKSTGIPIPLS